MYVDSKTSQRANVRTVRTYSSVTTYVTYVRAVLDLNLMAGLIGDLMKVRQRRMVHYQLQAADPHGGGGDP